MGSDEWIGADLQDVAAFHGHLCPGLLIGYRAARLAMQALEVERAADEDLVLITENDSCAVDAFQYLLSTTFGKGNLIFEDHGKQVFTVCDRSSGRTVRIALRADAFEPEEPGGEPLDREERKALLMSAQASDLFHLSHIQIQVPPRASIHKSIRCARCGEGAMETRTVTKGSRTYCVPCAVDLGLGEPTFGGG